MRFSTISLLFSLVAFIGCSPSDSGGDNTTTAQLNSSSLPQAGGDSQTVTPTQAVTHFLEALRSGDEALATSMLTDKAQAEMEKNEAAIKPPGSPTATFAVTEEEVLGNEQKELRRELDECKTSRAASPWRAEGWREWRPPRRRRLAGQSPGGTG